MKMMMMMMMMTMMTMMMMMTMLRMMMMNDGNNVRYTPTIILKSWAWRLEYKTINAYAKKEIVSILKATGAMLPVSKEIKKLAEVAKLLAEEEEAWAKDREEDEADDQASSDGDLMDEEDIDGYDSDDISS